MTPVSWSGKEALGDRHVEIAGEDEGRQGDEQRRRLVVEHDVERAAVPGEQRLEEASAGGVMAICRGARLPSAAAWRTSSAPASATPPPR